jgi:uncharacterized membrane protein YhaH (DUF805 family)
MNFHIDDYSINLSFLGILFVFICIALIVTTAIAIIRVIQRAGFSGWWALIMFVPILNMLALWYFGFGQWPIVNEPNSSNMWKKPALDE